jgi:Putative adhesin
MRARPETRDDESGQQASRRGQPAVHWIMRLGTMLLGIIAFTVGSASPVLAQRFPFEQSFDVTGPSVLDVSTIRGRIEVTAGEPGRIVVVGMATVRVDWNVPANAADLARKVANSPPIQREGQTVKLRPPSDPAEQRAVTVSYQVRVPQETEVTTASESGATTVRGVARAVVIRTQSGAIDVMQLGGSTVVTSGSGAVTVDGIAGSLTVTTRSSSVTARSIAGDLRVRTTSGAVDAALSGEGDADVETGSSAIRLSGIRGAVIAATRSGHVSLQGVPRRDWNASAGSGSIDIATESSVPFMLDASSGSGSVKVIGASVQGSVSKRKVAGSFAGGGPLVKVASRSGSIVVRLIGKTDRVK